MLLINIRQLSSFWTRFELNERNLTRCITEIGWRKFLRKEGKIKCYLLSCLFWIRPNIRVSNVVIRGMEMDRKEISRFLEVDENLSTLVRARRGSGHSARFRSPPPPPRPGYRHFRRAQSRISEKYCAILFQPLSFRESTYREPHARDRSIIIN